METNFSNAKLSAASLRYAKFEGVEMSCCDLTKTDFSNADASIKENALSLHTGNFIDHPIKAAVDLDGANLTEAKLHDANLAGALNLSLEAVNSAIGNENTILPDYIDRSEVIWLNQVDDK